MNILLTNDDGINAYGLRVLAEVFSELGAVRIVAPAHNQSGTSHGLTVTIPLRAREVDYPVAGVQAWAVEGTPADCVKLALEQLVPAKPDIVVAGINNGPNLGTDILYSGTVAGAAEGLFHGLPAIAVSVANSRRHSDQGNYYPAARCAAKYARLLTAGQISRTLLNINAPGDIPEDIRGEKLTSMGWRWYNAAYDKRVDPQGRAYYWLQGDVVDAPADGNTDVEVCAEGFTSITPLQFNLTDYQLLQSLR